MSISVNPSQFSFLNRNQNDTAAAQENRPEQALRSDKAPSSNPVAKEVVKSDRQSAQTTADNMLRFIGGGIDSLRRAGASEERVGDRIAAAREGVARGYAEAEEILEAKGLLNDELKAEIAAGRELIEEGIDRLERGEALNTENTAPSSSLLASTSQVKVSNSLSLDVVTRDGDRVKVSFYQGEQRSSSSAPGFLSASAGSQTNWQFEVQGNLDEGEREALSGLFDSVQDLSERFFGGDLGGALEEAMNLGFDGNELASLSLNLTQKTFASSTRAYSDIQPKLPTDLLEGLKSPLASYVDSHLAALDKASGLAEPDKVMQDLVNNLLPEEKRLPIWNSFHEGLVAVSKLANLNPQADK